MLATVRADAERPGTTAEVLLSYLIQEFGDNRSITSVVPLDNPAAADEPDLLALSPEQAEETQLCALPSPSACMNRQYVCTSIRALTLPAVLAAPVHLPHHIDACFAPILLCQDRTYSHHPHAVPRLG